MTGIELIAQERERQISKEGWTAEHDAEHAEGELAVAAACYAIPGDDRELIDRGRLAGIVPSAWPWDSAWWKPGPTRVRELVKAGALIAAEIDRLQRLAPSIPEKQAEEGSGKP